MRLRVFFVETAVGFLAHELYMQYNAGCHLIVQHIDLLAQVCKKTVGCQLLDVEAHRTESTRIFGVSLPKEFEYSLRVRKLRKARVKKSLLRKLVGGLDSALANEV